MDQQELINNLKARLLDTNDELARVSGILSNIAKVLNANSLDELIQKVNKAKEILAEKEKPAE